MNWSGAAVVIHSTEGRWFVSLTSDCERRVVEESAVNPVHLCEREKAMWALRLARGPFTILWTDKSAHAMTIYALCNSLVCFFSNGGGGIFYLQKHIYSTTFAGEKAPLSVFEKRCRCWKGSNKGYSRWRWEERGKLSNLCPGFPTR